MGKLTGKVAVVTGGNSGIGLATAKEFASEGAKVIIIGRDKATLDRAAQELNAALTLQVDVTNLADLERLSKEIQTKIGNIDVLFVNAGMAKLGTLDSVSEADFDIVMDVNFKGAFFTIQKLLPLLTNGASIILNGSVSAHVGFSGMSVYSASKAAIHSLARTLSAELSGRNIRVNTLNIGPINTPLYEKFGLPTEALNNFATTIQGKVAVKRFGNASEVAKAAVFLASDDSSFVVGSEVTTDGGLSLNMA